MLSKLVLAVGAALSCALVAAPVAQCCSDSGSQQASFSDGCCAEMPCCAISSDSATQPVTPAQVSSQLSVFPAPVCFVSLIDFPASPQVARFAKAQPVAHAPPPLALSCIFLI
jgi:hypothetical protein